MTELANTFSYDPREVHARGSAMAKPLHGDDQQFVTFDYHPALNRAKSRAEGRPVYENEIWVKIIAPGEAKVQETHRKANDLDKRRFPAQWQAFQQGRPQISEGTMLEHLFPAEPNKVKMLNHYNIFTIEQLANLNATGMSQIGMGAMQDVERAKQYISQAEKGVNYHKFNTLMEQKDQQISVLQQQVTQLGQQMQAMMQAQQPPQNQFPPQMPPQMPPQLPTPPNIEVAQALMGGGGETFMNVPDLSNQVEASDMQPQKRRGRPAGSKNKPKENE